MGARPGKANMQAKIAGHRTPVKNLWLSGHWADLGGGVPIAVKTAMNSSLLVIRELKPETFEVMANYFDCKISKDEADQTGMFRAYDNSWIQDPTPADKKRVSSLQAED